MKLAIAIVLACATPALADKKSDADALFKKAKKLHGDKKYAEACPMFEKSDALDPGIGAKLNVAKCYEDWGMLARAHRWYVDAEAMATSANDKRADKIKELITAMDSDVPRLTLKLPDGADATAAEVKLDGKAATIGKETRVDPGPHEITWRVEGKKKSKTIPMERGGERELTLDMRPTGGASGDGAVSARVDKPVVVDAPPAPGRTRRIIGLSVGAAGLVGMGVATYLTLDARSSYNSAIDTHCMGSKDMCTDEGLSITSDARSQANVATVITVVSLVAIGGGIVLYLTAPKGEARESNKTVYVTPLITGDTGGIVLGGGF
jgi:serine/threonine-protein kinase